MECRRLIFFFFFIVFFSSPFPKFSFFFFFFPRLRYTLNVVSTWHLIIFSFHRKTIQYDDRYWILIWRNFVNESLSNSSPTYGLIRVARLSIFQISKDFSTKTDQVWSSDQIGPTVLMILVLKRHTFGHAYKASLLTSYGNVMFWRDINISFVTYEGPEMQLRINWAVLSLCVGISSKSRIFNPCWLKNQDDLQAFYHKRSSGLCRLPQ